MLPEALLSPALLSVKKTGVTEERGRAWYVDLDSGLCHETASSSLRSLLVPLVDRHMF